MLEFHSSGNSLKINSIITPFFHSIRSEKASFICKIHLFAPTVSQHAEYKQLHLNCKLSKDSECVRFIKSTLKSKGLQIVLI